MRDWTENQIDMLWLRHGTTAFNKEGRYLGRTDEGLSGEGRAELERQKKNGCYPPVQLAVCSPMRRCVQTAKLLYPDAKIRCVEEFREIDFGAFEGKNYLELSKDADYQAWIDSGGTLPFPGGEARADFQIRCREGFKQLLFSLKKEFSNEIPQTALIVHGGTLMALLAEFAGGDYFSYRCGNGEGYRCRVRFRENGGEADDVKLSYDRFFCRISP